MENKTEAEKMFDAKLEGYKLNEEVKLINRLKKLESDYALDKKNTEERIIAIKKLTYLPKDGPSNLDTMMIYAADQYCSTTNL